MCYTMDSRRVGVRELRQNLSKYLRRVQRGERLEVTERGVPVAVLAPIGAPADALERLVAEGRVSEPRRDLVSVLPPRGRRSTTLSDALREERGERLR
jgi:prevent-host-death family protein